MTRLHYPMPIVRHADADAFLAAARPILARSEGDEAWFVARVAGIRARAEQDNADAYLATYAHAGAFGAAMHRPDSPVVVGPSDPAAAAAFAADLAPSAPDLPGIVGGLAACEAFAREWRGRTGRGHRLRFHLRHHVLTAVTPPPAPPGAARLAVDGDLDWLVAAQKAFAAEAGVLEPAERVAALVPQRLARGFLWVWDDGGAAAFAGWSDAGEDIARIAPVYTLPGARRRGYATALVAALAQGLLDRGRRRIFLVTDLANPTSNAIYARVGFRPLAELYHFDFVAPG